ncbi:tetratricopeptide repeat protein [Pustulibacterium marinum]|nr:hypothetical protein [Pustulibacterium marinum]
MKHLLLIILIFSYCSSYGQEEPIQTEEIDTLTHFFNFIDEISTAIDKNDREFIFKHTDSTTIEKILTKVPDTLYKDIYKKEIEKGYAALTTNMHNAINAGEYYNFINYTRDDDNTFYALFRYFSNDSGLNYHQYIATYKDDKFILKDIYILLTGQDFSDMLANSFNNSFNSESKTDADLYKKFLVLKNLGLNEKAFKVAEKITDTTIIDRTFLILKSQSASEYSDQAYTESMLEILEKYPQDPCITLLSIDYFYLKKDFNNLFRAIDDLEIYTDDDFLKYFKANYAFEIDEFYLAKENYEYIIKEYPSFVEADVMLLHTYHELDEPENAITLLSNMVNDGYSKKDLIDLVKNDMNDFYKTKTFKNWKKGH